MAKDTLMQALIQRTAPSADPETKEGLLSSIDIESSSQALLGAVGMLGEYHFPQEVIGGCCPRIAGQEQDIVWNAAAEACDSERIHLVWQSKGDRIWYLAVRSTELSSHMGTWCPFASLLPGMKDAAPPPVCYTYYSDEAATMMTLTEDSLQIHRGTSSVVRAKAERTARALGDAPVIELVPDRIEKLSPMPWYSASLFEERARRILAVLAVVSGIGLTILSFIVWLSATTALLASRSNMDEIEKRSEDKSLQLMRTVQDLHASPIREQLAKFTTLNDGLLPLNGYLEMYTIQNNKVLWKAVVPPNITSERISELGGQTLDSSDQGVVIGNSRTALTLGSSK